jgi:hypothetical protein
MRPETPGCRSDRKLAMDSRTMRLIAKAATQSSGRLIRAGLSSSVGRAPVGVPALGR